MAFACWRIAVKPKKTAQYGAIAFALTVNSRWSYGRGENNTPDSGIHNLAHDAKIKVERSTARRKGQDRMIKKLSLKTLAAKFATRTGAREYGVAVSTARSAYRSLQARIAAGETEITEDEFNAMLDEIPRGGIELMRLPQPAQRRLTASASPANKRHDPGAIFLEHYIHCQTEIDLIKAAMLQKKFGPETVRVLNTIIGRLHELMAGGIEIVAKSTYQKYKDLCFEQAAVKIKRAAALATVKSLEAEVEILQRMEN